MAPIIPAIIIFNIYPPDYAYCFFTHNTKLHSISTTRNAIVINSFSMFNAMPITDSKIVLPIINSFDSSDVFVPNL